MGLYYDILSNIGLSHEDVICEPIPRQFSWQGKEVCLTGYFHMAKAEHSKRLPVVVKLLKGLGASVTEDWRITKVDVLLVGQRFGRLKKLTNKIIRAKENNKTAENDTGVPDIFIFSEAALLKRLKLGHLLTQ